MLENIDRHRQMGKSAALAALHGAQEVWGAVFASTLTTVAVFLPIVLIQEEVGQLFRDIALAISCAIILSMVAALLAIPSLSALLPGSATDAGDKGIRGLFGLVALAGYYNQQVARLTHWICRSTLRRIATIIVLGIAPILASLYLTPKVEYLPSSNSSYIFGNIVFPSNYNLSEVDNIRTVFEDAFRLLREAAAHEAEHLPGGGVEDSFFIVFKGRAFMGASARDATRVAELIPIYRDTLADIPAAIGAFSTVNVFQQGGSGNSIDLDITGPDFRRLQELSNIVLARIQEELPSAQARPLGGIDEGVPEVRIVPHRYRSAELGLNSADLGLAVSAFVDGVKAADYQWEGKRIDLRIVSAGRHQNQSHSIGQLPIATPNGRLVTLDSVASIEETTGPIQIAHRERQRASTVQVVPPPDMPLQAVMEILDQKVIRELTAEGILDGSYRIIARGSADKLGQAWEALRWNFLLALLICYLLMCSVFESFVYPFVIMFTVPLAALGGIWGLWLTNQFTYQPLDVLTMLGFFILVGATVNNAILIVDQALVLIRKEGWAPTEAISEATRTRVRPIFMGVFTSVMGMAPLVLAPGAGSELYRGIGSIVVGGLLLSTVFTLVLVPAMLSLFLELKSGIGRVFTQIRPAQPES